MAEKPTNINNTVTVEEQIVDEYRENVPHAQQLANFFDTVVASLMTLADETGEPVVGLQSLHWMKKEANEHYDNIARMTMLLQDLQVRVEALESKQ